MIDHIDEPQQAILPAPPNRHTAMPGPRMIELRKQIPARLCTRLRKNFTPDEPDGFDQQLDATDTELFQLLSDLIQKVDGEHYRAGISSISELTVLRYTTGQYMRRHRDNDYEGAHFPHTGRTIGRVPFAFNMYLSDPGKHYDGGGIVIDDNPAIYPDVGSIVVLRGDVPHHVEPITRGERFIVKAVLRVPSPLRWTQFLGGWTEGDSNPLGDLSNLFRLG